jgi:hypothetical protein
MRRRESLVGSDPLLNHLSVWGLRLLEGVVKGEILGRERLADPRERQRLVDADLSLSEGSQDARVPTARAHELVQL